LLRFEEINYQKGVACFLVQFRSGTKCKFLASPSIHRCYCFFAKKQVGWYRHINDIISLSLLTDIEYRQVAVCCDYSWRLCCVVFQCFWRQWTQLVSRCRWKCRTSSRTPSS